MFAVEIFPFAEQTAEELATEVESTLKVLLNQHMWKVFKQIN